ncbi:DUF4189 domain-containing protein [Nocardia jejuensis]|uniref:DUF4189 domain-containing protein n=1 Tax=Nocardia jejuensis TaxID=328049 RepID=UPI00082FDA02|nr:DUF4189 domain-containing protein [Nocardia jejuensis]
MSLITKLALALVVPAAAALAGTGTAHAAGDLYGAIAVGGFTVGEAFDYPTQYGADQAALDTCRGKSAGVCYIQVRVHDECGVVLEKDVFSLGSVVPIYTSGTGASAAEAEQNARKLAGPEVNQPPFIYTVKPLFVLDTICTSNAR